jgi:hypothetical protein
MEKPESTFAFDATPSGSRGHPDVAVITGVDEVAGLVLAGVGKARFVPIPTGHLPPETSAALVRFMRFRVAGVVPASAVPTSPPSPTVAPTPSAARPPIP